MARNVKADSECDIKMILLVPLWYVPARGMNVYTQQDGKIAGSTHKGSYEGCGTSCESPSSLVERQVCRYPGGSWECTITTSGGFRERDLDLRYS
jgi:effector-binding domain-containing protein